MKLATSLFVPFTLVASTYAQGTAHAWVFANANFAGPGASLTAPLGTCQNVPGNLNDRISSFVVGSNRRCFFNIPQCGNGINGQWFTPGDYRTIPASLNDQITSYWCVAL